MTDDVKPLPPRALEILQWTLLYQRRTGYMPTVRETAAAFGMASTNGARWYLRILEARGYLVRTPGMARTRTVTAAGQQAAGL